MDLANQIFSESQRKIYLFNYHEEDNNNDDSEEVIVGNCTELPLSDYVVSYVFVTALSINTK